MEQQTDTRWNPEEPDAVLSRLRTGTPAAPGTDCPKEQDLLEAASGILRGDGADAVLRHAASCDHCGPLLRQALDDFSGDVSAEEEELLERAKPPKIPSLGAEMRSKVLTMPRLPVWSYAACAAALGAVAVLIPMWEQPSVDSLLASAYTAQRTFDLRIPGARYAPLRLERGSDRSRLDHPSALLDSEARIARELTKRPRSAVWLAARGRAELLERDYDSSIATLEQALAQKPSSVPITIDLGSAYFERGESRRSDVDYSLAAGTLSRVLQAKPDDAVALFNRAIVLERLHQYDRAMEDWQHYLRVETDREWIGEAKQRIADLERAKDNGQ